MDKLIWALLLVLCILPFNNLLQNYDPIVLPEEQLDPPANMDAMPLQIYTAVLRKGDTGPEVVRLQELLQLLGYLPPDALINGIYDEATQKAVQAFQRVAGVAPADGIAGPETLTKLYSIPIDVDVSQP
ncbi:MAG: peptidoglycan-binding protein [Clostridia bacterium]|nr:peptidoglycan-binding protein [Clostridia bacterium]